MFGVVDEITTTKFASRVCAVHCISLPVIVDKIVVVVLKFPSNQCRTPLKCAGNWLLEIEHSFSLRNWLCQSNSIGNCRGFHITFDKRVPKFVRKFQSWRPTWQFDHIVTNLVTNFSTRLGTTSLTSLRFCLIQSYGRFIKLDETRPKNLRFHFSNSSHQPINIKASTKVADIRTTPLHVFKGSHGVSESSSCISCWFTEGLITFNNENQRTKEGSTWKWHFDC